LANPTFQSLDTDLLDLFFACEVSKGSDEVNRFLMAKGGRLIRHLNLRRLSGEELNELILNGDINVNWLKMGLVEILRERSAEEAPKPKTKRVLFDESNPFAGIFQTLSVAYPSNSFLSVPGLLTVTCSAASVTSSASFRRI
jgi:hypothetical protein